MAPQIEQLIVDLANTIGATATHVWEVLVLQAHISAAMAAILWIIGFAVLLSLHSAHKKFVSEKREDEATCSAIIFIFWAVGMTLGTPFAVYFVLTGVINPEYLALKELLP